MTQWTMKTLVDDLPSAAVSMRSQDHLERVHLKVRMRMIAARVLTVSVAIKRQHLDPKRHPLHIMTKLAACNTNAEKRVRQGFFAVSDAKKVDVSRTM